MNGKYRYKQCPDGRCQYTPDPLKAQWLAEEGRKSRKRAAIAAVAGVAYFAFLAWIYFYW